MKLVVVEHTSFIVKTRFEKICSKIAIKVADKIVVLTEQYYQTYKQCLGPLFKKEKVVIIPNGINTDLFQPVAKKDNEVVAIGMAGRFTYSKRFEMLVQVVAELRKTVPNVILRLAGTGETVPDVKAYSNKRGIQNAVFYEGYLNESQMVNFYQSLHFYVHVSDAEAMCTSVMQAMACGVPVIASDIPGINNIVQHERTGLLCLNNTESFVGAILRLVANAPVGMAFSKSAREEVLNNYANTTMLAQYRKLLG